MNEFGDAAILAQPLRFNQRIPSRHGKYAFIPIRILICQRVPPAADPDAATQNISSVQPCASTFVTRLVGRVRVVLSVG